MLPSLAPLGPLEDLETYPARFHNLDLWRPYVEWVCRQHSLSATPKVRGGVPGTYPTFIADERWAVKFFGRLFEGRAAFDTEGAVLSALAEKGGIPAPGLVAVGSLQERGTGWPWPYLVMEFLPGAPLGMVLPGLTLAEQLRLAREIGGIVRRLHALPPPPGGMGGPGWEAYRRFLEAQAQAASSRHRAWGSLPPHLLDGLPEFLGPHEELVADLIDDHSPPHLIHADLTGDHFLARQEGCQLRICGLIDFGDAQAGDLFYELQALHLDLFGGHPRLLQAFLDAYQPEPFFRRDFARRALRVGLLHRFNVLRPILEQRPTLREAASLEELASRIWV